MLNKEIGITHFDDGNTSRIHVTCNTPGTPNSFKSVVIEYSDLTTAEKTKLDECTAMLEAKTVSVS